MQQQDTINKSGLKRILVAVAVLGGLTACEAISRKDVDLAKQSGKEPINRHAEGQAHAQTIDEALPNHPIPKAPEQSSEAYQSGYDDVWKENQAVQQLIVAELTRDADADHGASHHAQDSFKGETHSLLQPNTQQAHEGSSHQASSSKPEEDLTMYQDQYKNSGEYRTDTYVPEVQQHASASLVEPSTAHGQFTIHLASYRIQDNAQKGWGALVNRHGDVLGSLNPELMEVEIPQKGPFIRLMAGPFSNSQQASEACSVLKGRGEYCSVMSN